MDWIKMRANLRDDPAVWAIAKVLKMDPFSVIGRLHTMWSWFDSHATADNPFVNVAPEAMDDHLRCDGWCQAVAAAGWLIVEEDRLGVPNFDRHMGQGAKERAMSAMRVAKHRTQSANGIYRESQRQVSNAHVTVPPLPNRYSTVTKALHAKAIQDNTLSCNAPTVTSALQNRYQREESRGEREEEREESRAAPPPNQPISSNQIPNSHPTELEQFVDLPPEQRAAALQAKRQANLAERERHMAAMWEALAKKGIYPQGQERPPPSAQGAGSACRSTDPPIKRLEGGAFKEESGGSA